jgi:hypothetical protein
MKMQALCSKAGKRRKSDARGADERRKPEIAEYFELPANARWMSRRKDRD